MKKLTEKEFNEIMFKHYLWSKGHPDGECARFHKINFSKSGYSFTFKDLSSIVFESCNLNGVRFTYANMAGVTIKDCKVKKACFYGTNLKYADIWNSDLSNSTFEKSNITEAHFYSSKTKNTELKYDEERGEYIVCAT